LETRRTRKLEAEDRARRIKREDLENRALEQQMGVRELEAGIAAAQARRNIFGLEEIPGTGGIRTEEPLPELPTAPLQTRTAGEGGGGIGVRAQLPAGREPLAGPPPQRIRAEPPKTRYLEPHRDPTIVNLELMESEHNFGNFEEILKLPTGSLGESFRKQPAQTLNVLFQRLSERGGRLKGAELSDLRQIVQVRINSISDRMEFQALNQADEDAINNEIDILTSGLIEAATGYGEGFDQAAAVREINAMFPNETREEKGARLIRAMMISRGASEFAGAARGQLEPSR
jgi:hypothetical protein